MRELLEVWIGGRRGMSPAGLVLGLSDMAASKMNAARSRYDQVGRDQDIVTLSNRCIIENRKILI